MWKTCTQNKVLRKIRTVFLFRLGDQCNSGPESEYTDFKEVYERMAYGKWVRFPHSTVVTNEFLFDLVLRLQ
jgi:hypothetical protein